MVNKKNIINALIVSGLIAFFSLFFNFYINTIVDNKIIAKELALEKIEIKTIKIKYQLELIKTDSFKMKNEREHLVLSEKVDNVNVNLVGLNNKINILTYLVIKNNKKIKEQLNEIKNSNEEQFYITTINE